MVAKADAEMISIWNKVGKFLSKKGLYGHVGTIPHYPGRAARYREKEIAGTKGESEYEEFSVCPHSISGSSCIPNHPSDRDEEPVRASPTDSQRRLMFDHRVQLKHIREQDRSGWRNWQREWDRRMTSA